MRVAAVIAALATVAFGAPPTQARDASGTATYCAPTPRYCQSWGGTARLGAVQSFTWGDAPYKVRVCRRERPSVCTVVTVVSHCECGRTLIDLSPYSFRKLAPLRLGRIHVTMTRLGKVRPKPLPFLPPTDTAFLPAFCLAFR